MNHSNEFINLQHQLWGELHQAVHKRDHGWRTPVLSTVNKGFPDARTVVLRGVDPLAQTLTIFTDSRSPKVTQLTQEPRAQLVFWSADLQWQLRVSTVASIERDSESTAALWEKFQFTSAAGDYLTADAPGTPLSDRDQRPPEQHAFCLLVFQVESVDWLMLSREGHRRVRLEQNKHVWLTP